MEIMTKEYGVQVAEEPSFGFSVRPLFDQKAFRSRFGATDQVVDCCCSCTAACTAICTDGTCRSINER